MKRSDSLSEAMEVFLTQLPDPNSCNTPTFASEFIIKGKAVKLKAQKCKGSLGMKWSIESPSIAGNSFRIKDRRA